MNITPKLLPPDVLAFLRALTKRGDWRFDLLGHIAALERLLEVYVRKGKYHMEQWPGDKEMRRTIVTTRTALADQPGPEDIAETLHDAKRKYEI